MPLGGNKNSNFRPMRGMFNPLRGRAKMQRASDRLRKWKKRTLQTSVVLTHYVIRLAVPANKTTPAVNDRANDPTHLAPPSAYRDAKPPHLAVEQSVSIKLSRDHATSSRASRDSLVLRTMLDPTRGSFQLSSRSPIRCRGTMRERMFTHSFTRSLVRSLAPRLLGRRA